MIFGALLFTEIVEAKQQKIKNKHNIKIWVKSA